MNPEEKAIYSNLTVYRERGAYLRRLEQFDKAKNAYDEASKTNPEDVRLLIGRSQVCADAAKPLQAYSDAEKALKLEPQSMLARNVQAQALNTVGEFERALVMNHRGYRHRKQPSYFKDGIIQGTAILEDSVGANSKDIMLQFLPIIRKHDRPPENVDEFKKPNHISRIPAVEKKEKITQLQARKVHILRRVMAMKYLGPMAYDKFFLEDLKQCRSIESANSAGSIELKRLINEAYQRLCESQEMLRTQRPYYVIQLAEQTKSHHQDKFKEDMLNNEREFGARSAEIMLNAIHKNLKEENIKQLVTNAERMQTFLDKKTPFTLPDKDTYTDRLYRLVGEGYLCQYRLSYTLSERSNRRRVAFLMGIPVGRPSSYDSVLAKYPHKFIEMKLAAEKIQKSLDMCENSTMRCWLMYEMSKILSSQKNYSLAKFYGSKLVKEAWEIPNYPWTLNGILVLLCGEMQQNNISEIRALVEEGLQKSKKLTDPERVQAFLRKCEEMSHDVVTADERKIIGQRQNQILGIMDDVTRSEAKVLFKRIATMPDGRRFSVLPSQKDIGQCKHSARTKRRQLGLTIVPGPPKELPEPPPSDPKGFQKFEIYECNTSSKR